MTHGTATNPPDGDVGSGRRCLAVVPVRSFRASKTRLRARLDAGERSELMRALATGVVTALDGFDTVVVTDDDDVVEWARSSAVPTVAATVTGLDAAADRGREEARARGFALVAVVHADLARPASLPGVLSTATGSEAVIVADRHGTGTNVVVVPADRSFGFSYGPGSFGRHCAEAERAGLEVRAVTGSDLGWDVDTEDDYLEFRARPR